MKITWERRPGFADRLLWAPDFGQPSVRLWGDRWLGILWNWRNAKCEACDGTGQTGHGGVRFGPKDCPFCKGTGTRPA